MHLEDDTVGREISVNDKRTADILWTILMLTRLVIPAYVIYAIYLYWTLPPSNYLTGGY
ncbi:MAG TPA: hypothetical protein VLZ74_03505 [Methylocella sp.]|nr:hypothetical protein [Methylocella sp.]